MSALNQAVKQFPINAWCNENLTNFRPGEQGIADCPVCGGHRKLTISYEKKLFGCFRCRDGGHGGGTWSGGANLFQFMVILGRSKRDAYKEILDRAGVEDTIVERAALTSKALIPEEAIPLVTLPDHEPGKQMMVRRGMQHLIPHASVCADGQYKDRVVLPCYYRDELMGSECKAIYPSMRPKSLFHPPHQFSTAESVYTTRRWDTGSVSAAVTESIFDAESFNGLINAIGIYGCRLQAEQVLAIKALGIKKLIWALDGDAFYKKDSGVIHAITTYTLEHFENYVTYMTNDDDPNSLVFAGRVKLLEESVKINSAWDLYSLALAWGKM